MTPPSSDATEPSATLRTTTRDGVALAFEASGSGPGVLLVHGWPGDRHDWAAVRDALDDGHAVVTTDLRGFGDSDRPTGGYDAASVALDLAAVIEAAGIAPAHVVAHDIGGASAYLLAASRPDLVRSLTLIGSTTAFLSPDDMAETSRFWHMGFHATPDLPEALIAGREDVYLRWFFGTFAQPGTVPEEVIARAIAQQRRPGALAAGLAHFAAMEATTGQEMGARAAGPLAMPVLGVGGEAMGDLPARSLKAVAPDLRSVVLDGCGHWIPIQCPGELSAVLLDFFAAAERA